MKSKLSINAKTKLAEALHNGTFKRSLWDESNSKLAQLTRKPASAQHERTAEEAEADDEEANLSARAKAAKFTKSLAAIMVRKVPSSSPTQQGSNTQRGVANRTNQNEDSSGGEEDVATELRIKSVKDSSEDMGEVEKAVRRLAMERKLIQKYRNSVANSGGGGGSGSYDGTLFPSQSGLDVEGKLRRYAHTLKNSDNISEEEEISFPSFDGEPITAPDMSMALEPLELIPSYLLEKGLSRDELTASPSSLASVSVLTAPDTGDTDRAVQGQPSRRALSSAHRTHSAIARVLPVYATQPSTDSPERGEKKVSVNAFKQRLHPTASPGVSRVKKQLLLSRPAGVVSLAPNEAQPAHGGALYEFTLDFPSPPLSRLARQALVEAEDTSFEAVVPEVSPVAVRQHNIYLPVDVSQKKKPMPLRSPRPSATRPEFLEAPARLVTLSIGEEEQVQEGTGAGARAGTGRWGYDTEVETIPCTLRKPPPPATRLKTTFSPYPIAMLGGDYHDVLFDPRSMSLLVLAVKDGSVVSMVDVELASISASASPKFPDMIVLSSPQQRTNDGYIGIVSAKHWADIKGQASRAKLKQQQQQQQQQQHASGSDETARQALERRRRMLRDGSPPPAATAVAEKEKHDLAGTLNIFNMTSPAAPRDPEDARGRGGKAKVTFAPSPPEPPSLRIPAYSSSRTCDLLSVDSRDVMQIYIKVKLQPFFRSVHSCSSLGEALSLPHQNKYRIVFLNCLDIFHDESPYDSMLRLGGGPKKDAARGLLTVDRAATARLICVYGIPNHADNGEEMLAFVESMLSVGVTDFLDELLTVEQVLNVVARVDA